MVPENEVSNRSKRHPENELVDSRFTVARVDVATPCALAVALA